MNTAAGFLEVWLLDIRYSVCARDEHIPLCSLICRGLFSAQGISWPSPTQEAAVLISPSETGGVGGGAPSAWPPSLPSL